jgi:hypothetical protein
MNKHQWESLCKLGCENLSGEDRRALAKAWAIANDLNLPVERITRWCAENHGYSVPIRLLL